VTRKRFTILAMAATAIAALGLGALWPALQRGGQAEQTLAHPLDGIGGPFRLMNDRGEAVTEATLKGKPTLIFFGFTHCPDVCPTALFEMSERMKALGSDADRLNHVFVSVDPGRDGPEQLALYLQSFDPRIRGLTGTEEQIAGIIKAYKVYARRVPLEGGGYTMDHTASIYGADAQGRVRLLIDHQESREMALAKIRRLIALSP
jgi:protein SCO1